MIPFSKIAEINPKVKLEKGATFPFVEMAEVEPGRRYVAGATERIMKSGGAKFASGDTLFARITPCLENGKITQYKNDNHTKAFGSTEFFVFRAKAQVSDPSFVYYLSLSDYIRGPAEKSMSGASGRQRADVGAVREALVPNISFDQQVQIGQMLTAYDDHIEKNTHRIKILEEMAQAIYREWFVKFRFPGHEKVKMTDSSLGPTPEGWEVKCASETIEVNPRTKVPKEGEKPFVPMGSLSSDTMLIGQVEFRTGNSGSKFRNGDTLFARITPCLENGKTGYV